MKYFSLSRPIVPGGYPKGAKVIEVIDFDSPMEYLFQVAHDTRCSGEIQEYGFADLTGRILSDATGQKVSIYETAIMQPYTLIFFAIIGQ